MDKRVSQGLIIREVLARDRAAIVAVINSAGNLTDAEQACATGLLDIYLGDAGQQDYRFIAAIDGDDGLAGYACYGPRPLTDGTFDLYWIVVGRPRQRGGAGRLLVSGVEERLAGLNGRIIIAETSGLPQYESTRGFYLACGFIEEARIREFYKPGDDLIVYIKRL